MTLPQTVERIADILRRIVSNTTKLNAAAQARTAENCTLLGETAEAHERVAQLVATQSEIGQYFEEATGRVGIVEVESERLRVSIGEMDRHLGALLEDEATLQTALTTVTGHSRAVADIARLARLLAINASVEAARAGDAGRGFAVVAREMQSLSEQSSTRAKLIDDLVARLVDQLANMRGRVIGSRGPLEGLNEATGTVIKTLALARRRADETREVVEGTRDRICDETESLQHLLMRLGEVEAQTRFTINRSSENADLAAEAIAHLQSLGAGCDERPLAEA